MHLNLKYTLPEGYNKQHLINELADHYTIKKESAVAERLTIYDTFDWRLFNKSLVLYACGNRLFLRKLAKNEIMHSAEISTFPVFIWEFPEGELKHLLAPIIKIRALINLVAVNSRSIPYRILNVDEKTVARLAYEEFQPSRKKDARLSRSPSKLGCAATETRNPDCETTRYSYAIRKTRPVQPVCWS